jgi:hypothetical protein
MNKNIEGAVFEMFPVEARNFAYLGYNEEGPKLVIEFVRGPVYVYEAVPKAVFEAFLASDTPDAFFDAQIKNAYKNRRIF